MSILIKGMDLPKNEPLLVKINPDGSVSTTAKNGYKKYEAIPVPPHGRLIDSNTFVRSIRDAIHYDASRGREYISAEDLHEALTNAPTIIPAESSEALREYETAVEQVQYCELYEPTYDPDTGAL